MDREDEKRYTLDEYNWHILNNLEQFNDKANLIENLYLKMRQYLPEHAIVSKFYDYYKTVLEYYEVHKSFPNIQWLEVNYAKTAKLKRTDGDFSIQVYEDLCKQIDVEIIKKDCANIVQSVSVDPSTLRSLTSLISKYCDNASGIPVLSKNDIIGMYDEYTKEYSGVYTGIKLLDDQIGVLGHKSISVFGAPSGHGKSTFAITCAYNNAVLYGRCVDYISYEVPKEHIWFNLVSAHATYLDNSSNDELKISSSLISSNIKENKLTPAQQELFKEVAADLLKKIKASGGYINVIDQTSAAVDTFEGLCARVEGMATERVDGETKFDRKADLIIVDNVDNFQVLKSGERDEMVRINNYIVKLDAFCKQYHHGDGTAILLLTQLNRGGLEKLNRSEGSNDGRAKANNIDVSVFQRFNALYEKGTVCLVGYANAALRSAQRMSIYPVKLRNRGVPEDPIAIHADFAHSYLGGKAAPEELSAEKANAAIDYVQAEYAGNYEEVTDVDDNVYDMGDDF